MEAVKKTGETIIPTPTWVLVVRICQVVLSIITLGLAAWWVHGLYANPLGFAIVCVIFTWIVVAYSLVSERVPAARHLHNTWAVLALDGLMIVFWLAAMGALAAYRGRFTVNVRVSDCYSDGSLVNSNTCTILRKRASGGGGVAGFGILRALSANAGLCALNMLLFVATFAYVAHFFRLALAANNKQQAADPEKPTADPLMGQQQQQQQIQLQQYPDQSQMYAQQQQQPMGYPQQVPSPAPPQMQQQQQQPYAQNQQPYDPYTQPQNTAYAGAGGAYMPDQTQQQQPQQQQPMYSPQGTPAPGQPYQLPAN